jgi:mannose-1-phosphate guanylyltransferase
LSKLTGQVFDNQAVVGFFPSDHYYSGEREFISGVRTAFEIAAANPNSVILLGTEAKIPDTNFGYIEPAAAIVGGAWNGLMSVVRFYEKPSFEVARGLVNGGCVWNTFVMVGHMRAFLSLIQESVPDLYRAFEPLVSRQAADDATLAAVYDSIPSADFSRLVLSTGNPRLKVLNLGDVGWSDLGDPQRLIDTLSIHGIRSPWHQLWVQQMGIAPISSQ